MVTLLIGIGIGLLIGWNVLPQPKMVADLWAKVKAKFAD